MDNNLAAHRCAQCEKPLAGPFWESFHLHYQEWVQHIPGIVNKYDEEQKQRMKQQQQQPLHGMPVRVILMPHGGNQGNNSANSLRGRNAAVIEILPPKRTESIDFRKIDALPEPMKKQLEGMMQNFICPISLEIMKEPVVLSDGYSYEEECLLQAAIAQASQGYEFKSPMTSSKIAPFGFRNHVLKEEIRKAVNGFNNA